MILKEESLKSPELTLQSSHLPNNLIMLLYKCDPCNGIWQVFEVNFDLFL